MHIQNKIKYGALALCLCLLTAAAQEYTMQLGGYRP